MQVRRSILPPVTAEARDRYYGKETSSSGRVVFVRFQDLSQRKAWLGGDDPERGIFRRAIVIYDRDLQAQLKCGGMWQTWTESGKYFISILKE